jgi:hypothetical protein
MLRASTPPSSRAEEPHAEQLDVFGRRFNVQVECRDRLRYVTSNTHSLKIFGYSKAHALSNMHHAIVCLTHIEAHRRSS